MNRAPLVAVFLFLLLPTLYLGSYLLLVEPQGIYYSVFSGGAKTLYCDHYRWQNDSCERIFWPLERIDRKIRPAAWP